MGFFRGRNHEVRPRMQELVQHRPAQDGRPIRQMDGRFQGGHEVADWQSDAPDGVLYPVMDAVVAIELIGEYVGQVRNEDEVVEVVRVVRTESAGERAEIELRGLQ